jgi:hypothetical protein
MGGVSQHVFNGFREVGREEVTELMPDLVATRIFARVYGAIALACKDVKIPFRACVLYR